MIDAANITPYCGQMTRLARGRRLLMVLRLPSRHRTVVATEALSRRCLESAGDVTGRAIDRDVAPSEGKPGRKVIE